MEEVCKRQQAAMKIGKLCKKCCKLNYQLAKWEKIVSSVKENLHWILNTTKRAYKGSTVFSKDVSD